MRRKRQWTLFLGLTLLPCAPLSTSPSQALAATAAAEQSIQVQGQAPITSTPAAARQAALNDAVRNAIEQVLGAYISSSSTLRTTDEFEQLQQRLIKRSDGFGRVTQVLSEQQQGGTYTVTVRVTVARPSLEQELKAFLTQKGDPRIIVVIPEVILRRTVPDPAVETEVQRALIAAGYRVIDLKQSELNTLRDVVRGGDLDDQARSELGTRFKADLLVTGEAFAQEYGGVLNQRGYTARLELKMIDLATGQIVFSDAYTGTGTAPTDEVAGKTALQNVAKTAVPSLPGALLGWLSGNGRAAGRTFTVRLQGVPNFRSLTDMLARVRASAGVNAAQNRQFDNAGALLEVEYNGAPEDLAQLLEDLGLKVTGLSAGEITVIYP
ncbi:flagellar assembly protein T N-terminal domain-containing protein [Deinococcus hopiensis]|uniref:Flagellar assembly protein T, N-terminal domain n=1 Tax=Deinococcus hopiensis KR-140 TaxID=695939 RepID=A0A1W1UMG5_9DEIO|nr:flagellar assembly protein T N-terminal domain-containing protein [Deinococcus hopiensis]SMB81991.1 Flagellar assembly protein T, N-terminal domain [Deinococcus hopiensis KR-140]